MSCELIIQIFFDTFILSNPFSDRVQRSRWSVFVRIFVSKGNLFCCQIFSPNIDWLEVALWCSSKHSYNICQGNFPQKQVFSLLKQFSKQLICYAGCFSQFQVHCFCLPVMIYEVVEEEQEGEDTTGDGDYDEWENRNVFRSNKQLVN